MDRADPMTAVDHAELKRVAEAMTPTLAYRNGAVCFRAGRPMKESNPYRKGTQSHDHFVRGYVDEEVKR